MGTQTKKAIFFSQGEQQEGVRQTEVWESFGIEATHCQFFEKQHWGADVLWW